MKKQSEKKLSLKKLQLVKISSGLNSIRGGSAVGVGGGNDTILDNTDGPGGTVVPPRPKTNM
ncbi:hypothetical protein [Chryseobacterium hispalense]|uniref:hypothetical protein n=1 Tax=Chryseobacterium hispalense TaxID=1453492 RepID=UPI000493598F|nr:hypothetical protein [Chryseobacterium hispalense]